MIDAKQHISVLAIVKNDERYIFKIDSDPASWQALMQTLARFAGDKEL